MFLNFLSKQESFDVSWLPHGVLMKKCLLLILAGWRTELYEAPSIPTRHLNLSGYDPQKTIPNMTQPWKLTESCKSNRGFGVTSRMVRMAYAENLSDDPGQYQDAE